MTKLQENVYSTFAPTEGVLMEYQPVWSGMPGFVTAHDAFLVHWADIDPDAQKQIAGSTGVTIGKAVQRSALEDLTLLVSGNIVAYALRKKMSDLQNSMTFTETSIGRLRDNILLVTARLVRDTATTRAADLAGYGVSSEQLASLKQAITNFEMVVGAPRKAISGIRTATAGIQEKLADCLLELAIMDKLIENFRKDQPAFVTSYFNARKVIDIGHRHNQPAPEPVPPVGG